MDHEQLKKEIGERFRQAREYTGLKQKELAGIFDMNQSNIARIEKGLVSPNMSILNYLRRQHDINLNWLLTGRGEMVLKDKEEGKKGPDFGEYEIEVNDLLYHLEHVPEMRYPVLKYFVDYKLDHKREIHDIIKKVKTEGE